MILSGDIKFFDFLRRNKHLGQGLLNSYSQVFFSDNRIFALLIFFITFLVPASGFAGLAGICISLLLADRLGFDKGLISNGIFSYNTLLVALPLGLFFKAGWSLVLIIALASVLTFFLTVFFRSRMLRSNLPFLSWPFVISLWIIMLAIRQFTSIEVGDQSLFEWNRLYQVGGISLVNGVDWLNHLLIPQAVKTYLVALGAVFFQYNLIAGVAIAAGLIIYSRIAFLLSLLGFFSAYLFYLFIGLDINTLDYSYIGFNYILSAIAIGGFFLIPSIWSFLWTLIMIPVVTLLSVSMEELLRSSHLSVYALPFNLLVPVFLFVLQHRQSRQAGPQPVIVQHNSPEKNLYAWSNFHNRLSRKGGVLFRLPFLGSWKVSQGHDGEYTHQSHWRLALDFVKQGSDGLTYSGTGARLSDYLCYGKPVYPAADGVVDTVVDGIPDNSPGDANTRQNWGNTVVLKHAAGLYTKYSHLKPGSIRVKPGDYVLIGTELAQTGNSGRSPQPHLHFQFQAEPNIDAATIDYPFGYFLADSDGKPSLKTYCIPKEQEVVSNLNPDTLLRKALNFIPGQRIQVQSTGHNGQANLETEWEVHTDYYNNSYLFDRKANVTAWFVNDGQMFYFTYYEGSRDHLLFSFFSACYRIPFCFNANLTVNDQLPLSVLTGSWLRWMQDWIAPFYIFLRFSFSLDFVQSDDLLDPSAYLINSRVTQQVFGKVMETREYRLEIMREGKVCIDTTDNTLVLNTLNI